MSSNGIFTRKRLTERLEAMAGIAAGVLTIGNIYFVSSVSGLAANPGTSPDKAITTIALAIGLCTAGNNDVIICDADHAETIDSAAKIAFSKAGVQVIGTGVGTSRSTLTWATDTAATLTVTAAGCRLSGFLLDMRLPSALISGIVVSAASFKFDNNIVRIGTAGTGTAPLQAILTTAAADYMEISDNQFTGPPLTPTTLSAGTSAICLVGGTGIKIHRNVITGWFTTTVGGIQGITTLTNNISIRDNHITNQTAGGTKCIVLLTGSTGIAGNNRFGIVAGGTATAPITADAMNWAGNWSSAAGANGTLI